MVWIRRLSEAHSDAYTYQDSVPKMPSHLNALKRNHPLTAALAVMSFVGSGCDAVGWDVGSIERLRYQGASHDIEISRGEGRWRARVTRGDATSTFKALDDEVALLDSCWSDATASREEPRVDATQARQHTLRLWGASGEQALGVGPEQERSGRRLVRVSWGSNSVSARAECVRPLRQPERLLRDRRLLTARPDELTRLTLRRGDTRVELERRGPARWGPVGQDGELPAAPGVVRYALRLESIEEVGGSEPVGALEATAHTTEGTDTLRLWEDAGGWLARSRHTGATVRVGGDASGAVADLVRLMEQVEAEALAPAHAVDAEHGAGQR